jgi:hypothetical protein
MGCIFCSSEGKMSKEHLWSEWARKAIEADTGQPVSVVPHVIEKSDGSNKQWDAPVFSATLNKVCRDCNSTWMSDVEELTKDLVLPMLRNEQVLLGKEEQLCLAAWGYLKVLVHQRVDRQQILPADRYRGFHAHLSNGVMSLPRSATVFLAAHKGRAIDGGYTQHLIVDRDELGQPFFMATFTLRQVVLQVFDNLHLPVGIAPERPPSIADRDAQIWPVSELPVRWPPGRPLGDDELILFANLAPGDFGES